MIRILVRDISSKGMEIDQTIPKEGIGLSDEEVDIRSPLHVKAHVERNNFMVVANAEVQADYGFMCARCLEDLHVSQTHNYTFDFEAASLDDYFDLGEEIRQEMILANPAKILCKEDCKGICPKCGANLNKEQCKCKK
jgi:uncharacterized protein